MKGRGAGRLGGNRVRRRGGGGGMSGNNMGGGGQGRLMNGGKIPFDLTFFDDIFPRVAPAQDDTPLTAALLKRNTDLTTSPEELQTVQNLVTRIMGILEALILTPGTFDACQVEEIRQVGSFKQGTIIIGKKEADFVVILKTLPTVQAVEALSNKVADELRQTECVRANVTNRGFDLSNVQATVRIFITTIPQNFRKLDADIHLNAKILNEHWSMIRHSRWFEENAHNSTIKVLIRILRDMRQRFTALMALPTWQLDLLAHYCTMNNPNRQALPVNIAFRRTISLMASGMYLPGYSGSFARGSSLTFEEQDNITMTAQMLLRTLSHGGYKVILGLERNKTNNDIINGSTVWNGVVVVSPMEKAYEKSADGDLEKDEGEGEMEHEEPEENNAE